MIKVDKWRNSLQADLYCRELEIEDLQAKLDSLQAKEDSDIVEYFNKKAQLEPVAEPKEEMTPQKMNRVLEAA